MADLDMKKSIAFILVLSFSLFTVVAKEPPAPASGKKSALQVLAEGCAPATAQTDLNINNVRARILAGGDMWWDLNSAQYEVPKGSNKHSMFAGALWLGGQDEADQLKLAAMTYRQRGVDYWPGPLGEDAAITEEQCQDYDRHWLVYRSEVEIHKAWIDCKETPGCDIEDRFPGYAGNIPEVIENWPGNGINGELPYKLAPYGESDTNGIPGIYESEWDYPGYDFTRQADCQAKENDFLYGDQTIWWVYNDKGNIHTESNASALGFEIRAQAFAFTSNDEINNMTFNNYRILNRSSFTLNETFFGTWFDPDLGNFRDDLIGCDIARGLGYCYNSDLDDEGALGYGQNPPAVGFDFFQGPFADYFNGLDDDRDGCIDGIRIDGVCQPEDPSIGRNERIIMSGFMYYNNDGTDQGNPSNAAQFYNYLNNRWRNGSPLIIEDPAGKGQTGNGDGYRVNTSGFTPTRYAFPGESFDTTGAYEPSAPLPNGGWWESPDNFGDKRGLHIAGPFSLLPGALNFITTGTVWARNFSAQDIFGSVEDVIVADDKAQQLFDNCFQVLDGPDAPAVEIVELDQELIINLENAYGPNTIGYSQIDPLIPPRPEWNSQQIDSARKAGYFSYEFEGFQVFQVASSDVGVDELYNPNLSRLIAQSDLKNDVGQLVNYFESPDLIGNPLTPMDMTLQANNNGIQLSYRVTEDAFAEGDRRLINNKEYYFYVVAYAQNNYIPFTPNSQADAQNAQKEPYLAGRRNIGNNSKPYMAIPSKVENRSGGTKLNAQWGDEVEVTRVNGIGNGATFLRIAQETEDAIVSQYFMQNIKYQAGSSPISVKIIDPFDVRDGEYRLEFNGVSSDSRWSLYRNVPGSGDVLVDTLVRTLSYNGEQFIAFESKSMGFSISTNNPPSPGYLSDGEQNGIIGGSRTFADPSKNWLTGVPDSDAENPTNWVLAGSNSSSDFHNDYLAGTDNNPDPQGAFEGILGGTWAPFSLVSNVDPLGTGGSPGFPLRDGNQFSRMYPIEQLPNVDVVITKDPSKWTRVPVMEMGNIASANEGGAELFRLRKHNSLKLENGQLVEDPNLPQGWSYFPGYAINVESGKRLNLIMGENSWLKGENGDDMLWNPTANIFQKLGNFALGGMHTLYVMADSAKYRNDWVDLTYQGDNIADYPINTQLTSGMSSSFTRNEVWGSLTWATIGLLQSPAFEYSSYAEIPTDVRIELRVNSPYDIAPGLSNEINEGRPTYTFSFDGKAPLTGVQDIANEALDNIRVVPNPYYGSSAYEDGQLDNIVKITNLPQKCQINIFMTNGTLIRTINKDNALTFVEWDLKNDFNVPIASGIYLIHIDAGPIGETVVKWMGSLRPVDLNAF